MTPNAGEEQGSAAGLAGAVLTGEAVRQAAQEDARGEIVFPEEQTTQTEEKPATLEEELLK